MVDLSGSSSVGGGGLTAEYYTNARLAGRPLVTRVSVCSTVRGALAFRTYGFVSETLISATCRGREKGIYCAHKRTRRAMHTFMPPLILTVACVNHANKSTASSVVVLDFVERSTDTGEPEVCLQ